MTTTAKVIAHSVSSLGGPPLVTLKLRYPKFVHGEFLTHRMFSRNSSSSRAIPVERLIQDVLDDPVIPMHWGANQRGMQASEETNALVDHPFYRDDIGSITNRTAWLLARDQAVVTARAFSAAGYHKQIVNRLIEPFCHINTVVSGTQWSNFFALRCHKDAQPEMRVLAETIRDAMAVSTPKVLQPGEWHLPFVTSADRVAAASIDHQIRLPDRLIHVSVARCARVSYETHDGRKPDVVEDLALYDKLVGSVPLHASPAEHQATPVRDPYWGNTQGANFGDWWCQYRKTLPGECG